jgi:hypothetical protein
MIRLTPLPIFVSLMTAAGTQGTFLAYGVTCIFVVVGFFALNFFYISKLPPPVIHDGVTQEASYLAPHGVPGGGVSNSASNSRFDSAKGIPCDLLITEMKLIS